LGIETLLHLLQALAEVQDCVAFAGEQGVDADAGFSRDFLEAATEKFVGDEDVTLGFGEFVEGFVECVKEQVAGVEGVGAGIG